MARGEAAATPSLWGRRLSTLTLAGEQHKVCWLCESTPPEPGVWFGGAMQEDEDEDKKEEEG
jgi:hypothetical protein